MEQLKPLLGLLLFFLVLPFRPEAQSTLHLIFSIDQYNEDISKGCEIDDANLSTTLELLAEDAGMQVRKHSYGFNQQEAYQFFQDFTCSPDDVVVFFYSGHGFRSEDDNVAWPLMYYCVENSQPSAGDGLKSCGVPLDWVHHMLIQKGPRMSLTIGNSCNNVPGDEAANERAKGLKKQKQEDQDGEKNMQNMALLTQFKGHIIASGASPGQFAYTNDEDGSYFVNELTNVLLEGLLFADNPTSWASMLKKTRDEVQKEKPDQRPQFLIVADNKKMYSEGSNNYVDKASYEELGLDVPEVDDEYYDSLELDDFDEDDYAEEWEMEFDQHGMEEQALENLPYILLNSIYLDDNNVSSDELNRMYQYYLNRMDDSGYDQETAKMMFEFAREDLGSELFQEFLQDAIQEFKEYLDEDTKSAVLSAIETSADYSDAESLQNFIEGLRS